MSNSTPADEPRIPPEPDKPGPILSVAHLTSPWVAGYLFPVLLWLLSDRSVVAAGIGAAVAVAFRLAFCAVVRVHYERRMRQRERVLVAGVLYQYGEKISALEREVEKVNAALTALRADVVTKSSQRAATALVKAWEDEREQIKRDFGPRGRSGSTLKDLLLAPHVRE